MRKGFKGMPQLISRLRSIPARLDQEVKNLVQDTANNVVRDAVNNIRANGNADLGGLMQSINAYPDKGGLAAHMIVQKEYGAAQEFGTKGKVRVPIELAEYAAQFKGIPSGGTWTEFLAEIKAWVKRKGITGVYSVKTRKRLTGAKYNNDAEDERAAYLIAMSIYLHGVTPKPYFFPAWFKNSDQFKIELKKVMKRTIWQKLKDWFR